jgi:hypothetical protein
VKDNGIDNVHPVRNFIDKKTKNTLKPWFDDKNDDPNNNSEAKKAIIKIIKIIGIYALLALIISYFI